MEQLKQISATQQQLEAIRNGLLQNWRMAIWQRGRLIEVTRPFTCFMCRAHAYIWQLQKSNFTESSESSKPLFIPSS